MYQDSRLRADENARAWPSWSLFAEYNYLDFGSNNLNVQGYGLTAAASPAPILVSHRIDTAVFGVDYRFDSP